MRPQVSSISAKFEMRRQDRSISAKFEMNQRLLNGTIHEVIAPDGGPLGGKSIDDAFYKFLSEICGRSVMEELKTTDLEDYVDVFRNVEE
jgi:hypothetical protein